MREFRTKLLLQLISLNAPLSWCEVRGNFIMPCRLCS